MNQIHPPFHLPLDEFLKGEGCGSHDLEMIDDVEESHSFYVKLFGKNKDRFSQIDIRRWSSLGSQVIYYAKTRAGLIALDFRNDIVAFYEYGFLSVSEHIRQNGVGTELVILGSLLQGGNPAWAVKDMYPLAYTRIGLRTHIRAWELYRRFPERYVSFMVM